MVFILAGARCVVCSTLNVYKLYKGVPGAVQPTSLLSCIPQIISGFVKGSQQCSAEFFQAFWRILGETAQQLQYMELIPRQCSLEFLNSFCFSLSSEILCSECNNTTSNCATETVLPLSIMKVHTISATIGPRWGRVKLFGSVNKPLWK